MENSSKENDCNCKIKSNFPMKGLCNLKSIIPGDYFPRRKH